MNKLLIVLLAVCLFSVVSAHGFVKRDAPAANDATPPLEAIQQQIAQLTNDFANKLADTVNPETIKKNVNDLIDGISNVAQKLTPVTEKPAA